MYREGTIAAISTPPGNGGLAVIRISGEQSYLVAARVFVPKNKGKSVEKARGYTALYGDFCYGGEEIDDGVALFFRAPHSYTGEDVVELSCHGGAAVTGGLLRACLEAGAKPAEPGEFTKRALLNGRMNLTQAEAVLDLISAHSRQAAAAAHAALKGELYNKIEKEKQRLTRLAGHLAAQIDFPEEDVEVLETRDFIGGMLASCAEIQRLIDGYHRGMLFKRGVRVAIVGSPNVGKSTLFNLISGFERAIVTPVAGTTRDVIREEILVAGVPLQLADTAGLHATEDSIEAEGIKRSYDEIEQAGLILAVFDGSTPFSGSEWELAQQCAGRPALAVVNKSDLGLAVDIQALERFFAHVVVVSAKEAQTKEVLEQAVAEILQVNEISTESMLLANERQLSAAIFARDSLEQAVKTLENGFTLDAAGVCLDDALRALAELTGENVSDAVVDDIFTRFCVGK